MRPTVETMRLAAMSTVGKPYSCSPVKVARKTPKGRAKATDMPTAIKSAAHVAHQRARHLGEEARHLPYHAEDSQGADDGGSQHDSERGTDGLARGDAVACRAVLCNEFADGGLQSKIEKVHIGAKLQD